MASGLTRHNSFAIWREARDQQQDRSSVSRQLTEVAVKETKKNGIFVIPDWDAW